MQTTIFRVQFVEQQLALPAYLVLMAVDLRMSYINLIISTNDRKASGNESESERVLMQCHSG